MRRAVLSALVVVAATLAPAPGAAAAALCNGLPVTMTVPPGGAEFPGTPGADVILGTSGPDFIKALGGDDVVCGGGGDDVILGGPGNDTLLGEDGNDKLRGAAGNDMLLGGAGSDRALPETGTDVVDGGGGSDIVDYLAAAGPVSVDLGAGTAVYSPEGGGTHTATLIAVEKVDGSRFADTLVGDGKRNVLRGKQGVDRIVGGAGDDDLIGGTDRDTIRGGGGADLLKGQAGDDDLDGGAGDDRMVGGAGSDTLAGGDGNDTLIGGLRSHEGEFTNTMDGGDGFDTCRWDFDPIVGCETQRPAADLDLTMAAIPSEVSPGGTVVLRLTVANRGPDAASGVTVAAPLPSGLAYRSHSGRGSYAGGIWAVGSLAAGAVAVLEITALVGVGLPITASAEIATASPYDPDSTPGNGAAAEDDRAAATITRLPPSADLSLTMTASDLTPDYGSTVAFTLEVTNDGPDPATGVVVTDRLPAGLSFVSAAGDGPYSPSAGTWAVGTVQAGSSASIQIVATVATTAPVANSAEITASDVADPDSTPGNGAVGEDDTASATIDAPPAADLELAKTVDDPAPNLGDEVTFTVTVRNDGPDPAAGVVVTDGLPAGLSYLRHVGAGSYDPGSGVWTVGSLGIGASRSVHVTAEVETTLASTGPIVGSAEIISASPDDPDSTPGNGDPDEDDYDSAAIDPNPAADLRLAKTVDDPAPLEGAEVTFTLTVANDGPDPATGVEVTDLLPAGLSYVSDDGTGSYEPGTGVWTVGALGVGSRSLQVTALVETTVPTANVAEVTASDQWDPDSTPGNGDPAEDDRAAATVDGGPVDDTPPSLTGLSISPAVVDIATSDQQVTVTIQVTDDLSGVADGASMEARFSSPSGVDSVTFAFESPVSGTDLDAGFSASGLVGFGAEPGTWTLDYLFLEDDDLNGVVLTAADVAGLGLPATFAVTGPPVDLTPPSLAGFTISPPGGVDITPGDQQVTLTMRVTDDLSGVAGGASMSARFVSPSLVHSVTFRFGAPVSGSTDLDATFEATNWVVAGSEPGIWTLEYLALEDDDGNATTLDASDLAGLGFPSTFPVTGPPVDFTPPSLVDFTIVPPSVDVTSKAQEVTVTLRVTDDLAGVADLARMDARFRSPSNLDVADFDFAVPKPGSSDLDAEFEATDLILTGSEPGTWTLDYLYLVDDEGNGRYLDAADLYELGLPYSFEVVGSGDVTPPTLADFDITPAIVDVTSGEKDITVTMRITDDISGVAGSAYMYAEFWSPSGFEWVELDFGSPKPGSKDLDAVFEASATFDQYSEPGTWTLAFLYIEDDDLNGVELEAADLAGLGFPNSFEVVGSPAGSPF